MSTFNHRNLKKQELLAKEDIDILLEAIRIGIEDGSLTETNSIERLTFLSNKLRRMKKQ